ncbi:hypothetical protein H0H93_016303 [Arthromyces matolae]|nr:hypothetical protein H0H93_016303 [Arthromyces matolae]
MSTSTSIPIPQSDVTENDTLALIVGESGAGKSTFINRAANTDVTAVGADLDSATQVLSYHILPDPVNPAERYVLVDTPGFNDSNGNPDQIIFSQIADYLRGSPFKMKILVVYLIQADMPDDAVTRLRPLTLLKAIGKKMALGFCIAVNNATGVSEEKACLQEDKYRANSSNLVYRFHNSHDSAWDILRGNVDRPLVELTALADALPVPSQNPISHSQQQQKPWYARLFGGKKCMSPHWLFFRKRNIEQIGDLEASSFLQQLQTSVHSMQFASVMVASGLITTHYLRITLLIAPQMPAVQQWEKEIKPDDHFITNGREGDLVIPIMGPTGAGKSTFINTLLGASYARVGHDLQSETQYIHHYALPYPGRRIYIVDTPGFDDTSTGDREILRRIAVWMAKSYRTEMKVGGIIYLQEITQTRVTGTTRKNMDMFEKLCGPNAASSITLATTKWTEVKESVGRQREAQLRDEHWKDMLRDGSKIRRFEGSRDSAQKIVNEILARKALDATQIQGELVDVDKLLAETDAGRTLRYTLKELLEQQKKMAERLRQEGGDDANAQLVENDNKIRAILGQIHDLNIPLGRKIMRWLGIVKG